MAIYLATSHSRSDSPPWLEGRGGVLRDLPVLALASFGQRRAFLVARGHCCERRVGLGPTTLRQYHRHLFVYPHRTSLAQLPPGWRSHASIIGSLPFRSRDSNVLMCGRGTRSCCWEHVLPPCRYRCRCLSMDARRHGRRVGGIYRWAVLSGISSCRASGVMTCHVACPNLECDRREPMLCESVGDQCDWNIHSPLLHETSTEFIDRHAWLVCDTCNEMLDKCTKSIVRPSTTVGRVRDSPQRLHPPMRTYTLHRPTFSRSHQEINPIANEANLL